MRRRVASFRGVGSTVCILGIVTGFILIRSGQAAPSAYCNDVCWNCPRDYECIYDPDALYCIDGTCPHGAPCKCYYDGGTRIEVSCPKYNWCLLDPQETATDSSSLEVRGATEAWAIFSFYRLDTEGRPLDLRLEATNDPEYAYTQAQRIILEPSPVSPSALGPSRRLIFSLRPPSGIRGGLPRLRFRWQTLEFSGLDFSPRPVWVVYRAEWSPHSSIVFEESNIIYSEVPWANGQIVDFINRNLHVEAVWPPGFIGKSILFLIFRLPPESRRPKAGIGVTGYTL